MASLSMIFSMSTIMVTSTKNVKMNKLELRFFLIIFSKHELFRGKNKNILKHI